MPVVRYLSIPVCGETRIIGQPGWFAILQKRILRYGLFDSVEDR